MELLLVAFDDADPLFYRPLAKTLANQGYNIKLQIGHAMPERAFNPSRGQYAADAALTSLRPLSEGRILGITGLDLYRYICSCVFGLAELPGRLALISHHRPAQNTGPITAQQRINKLALHELGHTWGLEHCPNRSCAMCFSATIEAVDQSQAAYCSDCHARLKGLRRLHASPSLA